MPLMVNRSVVVGRTKSSKTIFADQIGQTRSLAGFSHNELSTSCWKLLWNEFDENSVDSFIPLRRRKAIAVCEGGAKNVS